MSYTHSSLTATSRWNWVIQLPAWMSNIYLLALLIPRLHDTTSCQAGCTTGLTTGCIHDTAVCQTGCQMGLTTGWMFVYTIQPVVKPDWQQVVSCKRDFNLTMKLCTNFLSTLPLKTLATSSCRLTESMGRAASSTWLSLVLVGQYKLNHC